MFGRVKLEALFSHATKMESDNCTEQESNPGHTNTTKGCFPVMCAQYASMNEFTCSEHSIRMRTLKKRITGK